MSFLSIATYFGETRAVITGQEISMDLATATIKIKSDKRYIFVCRNCGGKTDHVCSHHERFVG